MVITLMIMSVGAGVMVTVLMVILVVIVILVVMVVATGGYDQGGLRDDGGCVGGWRRWWLWSTRKSSMGPCQFISF